ncbi:Elongation factor P-like protein [Dirofilaria immitis]
MKKKKRKKVRKEKETLSTTCPNGITSSAEIISTIPSDLSLTSSQDLEPTSTIKGSQEYITPIITSNQASAYLFAETADTSSYKSDESSITSEYDMMFDTEPVILSTPACQVLNIIRKKQLFKNTTATESENDLIRMYFAGKIPREREKDAQQTLEKAVGLAVTRVKSSGLTEGLYNFLNNNREMAVSLIIDAMKYRKKEFLPEFWNYDLTIKSSSDLNNSSPKQ